MSEAQNPNQEKLNKCLAEVVEVLKKYDCQIDPLISFNSFGMEVKWGVIPMPPRVISKSGQAASGKVWPPFNLGS